MTATVSTTETKSSSRRALLAGAVGGLGAVVAGAVGGRGRALAGTDGDVVLGAYNEANSSTRINNTNQGGQEALALSSNDSTQPTLRASHQRFGTAIHAHSDSTGGKALFANQNGAGLAIYAQSAGGSALEAFSRANKTGAIGFSGPPTATAPDGKAKTGVYGEATQDFSSRGVWGRSNAGQGVRGQATSGVGLYGTASSGFALRTSGRVKADKVSGVATIPAGSSAVTVTPNVNVTGGSFVLLTPKANIGSRGLWFTTNSTANTFRIRMSSSRSSNTKVAWLLLG